MKTQYTDQRVFGPYPAHYKPAAFVVAANGGTVTVEADVGNDEWSAFLVLDENASQEVMIANNRFRVTPTGSAVYAWSTQ